MRNPCRILQNCIMCLFENSAHATLHRKAPLTIVHPRANGHVRHHVLFKGRTHPLRKLARQRRRYLSVLLSFWFSAFSHLSLQLAPHPCPWSMGSIMNFVWLFSPSCFIFTISADATFRHRGIIIIADTWPPCYPWGAVRDRPVFNVAAVVMRTLILLSTLLFGHDPLCTECPS